MISIYHQYQRIDQQRLNSYSRNYKDKYLIFFHNMFCHWLLKIVNWGYIKRPFTKNRPLKVLFRSLAHSTGYIKEKSSIRWSKRFSKLNLALVWFSLFLFPFFFFESSRYHCEPKTLETWGSSTAEEFKTIQHFPALSTWGSSTFLFVQKRWDTKSNSTVKKWFILCMIKKNLEEPY